MEQPPPFRYEPYLDGLFTYCLSVLCDHDTATDVLGDVLAVAERYPGRCPDEGDRRAWLYALARWACLRRLAERRRERYGYGGAHSARRAPEHAGSGRAPHPAGAEANADTNATANADANAAANAAAYGAPYGAARPAGPSGVDGPVGPDLSAHRRTELARLAWPEAAGTTPEQREALELAVRHRLAVAELAAVLGTPPATARELLSGAACEVERTRAALAVVETGNCPSVSRLTGEDGAGGETAAPGTYCCPPPCAPSWSATSTTARAAAAWPNASEPARRGPARAASTPPPSRWSRPRAPPSAPRCSAPAAAGAPDPDRASTAPASRWTPRTARPAATGCAPGP